jgi:ubiquinone/menaquinone biosynthesis C-methylase UbiE
MKDNFFSPIAKDYAQYRPSYPPELFAYLADLAPGRTMAWDCATGSGQAAQDLVKHFDHVEATDISTELLAQAKPHKRIVFRQADALRSGLADHSVDLITVANAMHWFHGEDFDREARRVLKPSGIIAAWSFAFNTITPAIDRLTRKVHNEIVDPYWIEPNRIVEHGYKDLRFGFEEITSPSFSMMSHLNMDQLEGYMRTWSASVKYQRHHGVDPVSLVHEELLSAWGDPAEAKRVRWQLNVRMGMV